MKRFFALSRTSHGILDLATPAFCALLWLGAFPPWPTIVLALCAGFAAYTAIYALNDLMGMRTDREKFAGTGINPGYSVEASAQRYPLAQDILNPRSGWLWWGAWFALALVTSYLLNPAIVIVLSAAAVLEVAYCLLLKVTYLRTLVSGLVKSGGPLAAVLVVDPRPAIGPLLLLLAWVFFWEIGGQNIPADWNDTEEDRRVNAKTIPIRFGFKRAGLIVVAALAIAVVVSGLLPLVSRAQPGWLYTLLSVAIGYWLLLRSGLGLSRSAEGRQAARLFDRASYYPLAECVLLAMFLLLQRFTL